ncbi:M23 family metallopeptidase [Glutamicibacter sp. NPDC087673]|uniref:M23 family metallopeptidase n=1 Tax=Glutamicibacter sp. NPDC087673 TaxID=3363997 RepID=UPI0037FA2F1E
MSSMVSPLEGRATSGFKTRARPDHAGQDIAPQRRGAAAAVRAMFAGTVIDVERGQDPGDRDTGIHPGRTGNGIRIRNTGKGSSGDREIQLYNHVYPSVNVGDVVAAGDVIGRLDDSGNQTGRHLHLETWDANGNLYDPVKCFKKYGIKVGAKPDVDNAAPEKETARPAEYDPAVKKYQDRQIYYPNMLHDGIDGPRNKAHKAWVEDLQRELNKWKSDLPDLVIDGDYSGKTGAKVREIQTRNKSGAYRRAGGRKVDRIAGPVMCKMLGMRKHPSL